jgi:hypothetical protein
MEYDSAITNEIMLFAGKWMKLELMLSEISQTVKDRYCTFYPIGRI